MARAAKPADADIPDAITSEEGAAPAPQHEPSPRKYEPSWVGVAQTLTEKDLESAPTRKMLVNELHRLSQEVTTLGKFRDQFYEMDKKCEVLLEREKHVRVFRTASAIFVSLGSICSGLGANQVYASIGDGAAVLPGGVGIGLVMILLGLLGVFVPIVSVWASR